MKNSYRFFKNDSCEFYPCHKGIEEINCLFCYCPFYLAPKCPGKPEHLSWNGKTIKDCSNCVYPHKPENYERIMKWLSGQGQAE